jgi:hypothetical protein
MTNIISIELLNELSEELEEPSTPTPAIILEPDSFPPGVVFPRIEDVSNNDVYIRPTGRLNVSSQYEFAEVQITRTLNEHPTATATFYTTEIPSITIGGQLQLLGINFVIESYSINIYKGTSGNAIAVNLSLLGEFAPRGSESALHPLDRPITFRVGTTRITWGTILSSLTIPININSTGYDKYYSGQDEIVLTPRAELEAASLLSVDSLIKYSSPTITSIPSTGLGSTIINDAHILDEVSLIEVKDKPKYINVELILDLEPSQVDTSLEISTRFEYENCISVVDQAVPGGTGLILVSNIADDLKDPGNNFDNGGRTKTSRRITEKNGNPLTITEIVYGYAFVSSQLFRLPTTIADYEQMQVNGGKWPLTLAPFSMGVQGYWQIVQRTITTFEYDNEGYLTSSNKTGWKLGRLKRESGEYEAANIWIDTFKKSRRTNVDPNTIDTGPPPAWKAAAREYNAYLFFNPIAYTGDNPVFPNVNQVSTRSLFRYLINESSNYYLSPLSDYYPDINTPDGQPVPRFVYRSSSFSNYQEVQPNPKDDPRDPGSPYTPLIAHKENKESSTTQIIIPASLSAEARSPEMYSVVDYVHAVEGDHSSSSLKIGNSTQYLGRPSTHTQLPVRTTVVELPTTYLQYMENRYFIDSIEENVETPTTPTQLSTGGNSRIPTPSSTVSFSGALSPDIAKRGALNSLIRKSINTVTTRIRVPFFEYYSLIEEGSKIIVSGTEYIVTSVSYSIKLYNPGEYYCPDGLNLSLAVIPQQAISMRSYRRNDT